MSAVDISTVDHVYCEECGAVCDPADDPKWKSETVNEREATYGDPAVNLGCAAELWSAYLEGRFGEDAVVLTAHDVAVMMVLVKIARIATGAHHKDNYEDIAGYAEIAGRLGGGAADA